MAAKASPSSDLSDSVPILATELDDILGHRLIKNLLGRMLNERRLPQALLFAGVPLLGKRSMAVVLAKRLLSAPVGPPEDEGQGALFDEQPEDADSSPAESLRPDPAVSRRVTRGAHLDFSLVQPEGGSKVVKIEQVRTLQDWAWISPSEGAAKVALVFGADTITEEAANSFLKLLEEPPPRLTLILVSDFPHRLLETVRSRCTLFAFHPIPSAELEAWLEEHYELVPGRARLIAGLSEGRPGLAADLVEEESISVRRPLLDEMETLLAHGFLALPGVAARCLRRAGGLRPALEGLLFLLREGLILSDRPETADILLGTDLRERTERAFAGVSRGALIDAAEAVAKGLDITRHLFIPSEALVLENVLADVGVALRRKG